MTGANGFVGAAVCQKLLDRGDEVHALVRATSDLSLLEGLNVHIHVGSLQEIETVQPLLQGVQVIYHVAAAVGDWGPLSWFRELNVEATRRLLETAAQAGVRRLVYVSSVAVHSFVGARNMHENSPQLPTPFPYCQSKREAEMVVRDFHSPSSLETVIIRPGDVYGPGDRTSLLKMASMLEKGGMLLVGGGKTLGAFTYVENLADGIVLGGTHPEAAGDTFIITDGMEMSWKTYFDKLTAALDLPRVRWSVHPVAVKVLAGMLEGVHRLFRLKGRPLVTRYLVDHLCGDFHFRIDKAQEVLGYVPAVGVDEAIQRTAAWYRRVVRGEAIATAGE